ncbi:hypothetical protein DL93DRAFT_2171740 [Clavulina sp. PMI_390]|nr:hypothetical protein DL93DRAFT_2171740 [Clavulina sp. PMI_390]
MTSASDKPARHPDFYFDEPDTIVFKVDDILFRPHLFTLRRYCGLFRDLLDFGSLVEYSDEKPFTLANVHLADGTYEEISSKGFALALSTMYPESMFDKPPHGADEWMLVLDASHRWQSDYMRRLAIHHLSPAELDPSTRLRLASSYAIDEWLGKAYIGLCRRRLAPTPADLHHIHPHHAVALFQAREELLASICTALSSTCGVANQQCAMFRLGKLRAIFGGGEGVDEQDLVSLATKDQSGWCSVCKRSLTPLQMEKLIGTHVAKIVKKARV